METSKSGWTRIWKAFSLRKTPFDIEGERQVFESTFSLLSEKFGQDAFARHRDGQPQGRLAPAYFEAAIGGILANMEPVRNKSPEALKKALGAVFELDEFRRVTGPGANTIEKLNERIRLVSVCFGA